MEFLNDLQSTDDPQKFTLIIEVDTQNTCDMFSSKITLSIITYFDRHLYLSVWMCVSVHMFAYITFKRN